MQHEIICVALCRSDEFGIIPPLFLGSIFCTTVYSIDNTVSCSQPSYGMSNYKDGDDSWVFPIGGTERTRVGRMPKLMGDELHPLLQQKVNVDFRLIMGPRYVEWLHRFGFLLPNCHILFCRTAPVTEFLKLFLPWCHANSKVSSPLCRPK